MPLHVEHQSINQSINSHTPSPILLCHDFTLDIFRLLCVAYLTSQTILVNIHIHKNVSFPQLILDYHATKFDQIDHHPLNRCIKYLNLAK